MIFHVQFPGLGLEFDVNRVALSLGGFNIYWYGILIALGMVLALAFAFRYAVDFGVDSDRFVDVVIVGTVMAIICARAYYVAFAPFKYENFLQMLDIRQGGIAIYGGVIGAALFGGLMAKFRKVPVLPLFDLVAMGFFIGQGIGRWGNFVNQEAFGCNTTLPWGMFSEGTQAYLAGAQAALAAEGVTVDPTMPVHPTFLYESIWCLLGFLVLLFFMKRRRFNGQLALTYVIWYGLGRYVIEGLRTDALLITPNLRTSQLVALVSVAVAVILMVFGLQKHKGEALMVPLPVADLKKQAKAQALFTVDTLSASAAHKEFTEATAAMNKRLAQLDETAANEVESLDDTDTALDSAQADETAETPDSTDRLTDTDSGTDSDTEKEPDKKEIMPETEKKTEQEPEQEPEKASEITEEPEPAAAPSTAAAEETEATPSTAEPAAKEDVENT